MKNTVTIIAGVLRMVFIASLLALLILPFFRLTAIPSHQVATAATIALNVLLYSGALNTLLQFAIDFFGKNSNKPY